MKWQRGFDLALSDTDTLVVRFNVERGRVTEFVVHGYAHVAGEDRELLRYDTCHGRLHVHRFSPDGEVVRDLPDPAMPRRGFGDALDQAYEDARANWRSYRARWEGAR